MPLILGAQSALGATALVTNSCLWSDDDSAGMNWTPGSSGDTTEWTFSAWVKPRTDGATQVVFNGYDDGSNETRIFISSEKLSYYNYVSAGVNGEYITSQLLQDPSAWYHIVVAIDNDEGVAGNRIRFYINGAEVTAFGTETDPSSGSTTFINADNAQYLGQSGSGQYYDGYMSEVVFIDGQQLAASDFGEFDEDSPTIWKPIDVSGLTFGSNGFYLDFEDSADLGADVSGNSNDFTLSNIDATDQTTDTPVNNFATWNPVMPNYTPANNATYSDGNLSSTTTTTGGLGGISSQGSDVSKWYAEIKLISESSSDASMVGAYKNPNTGLGNNSPHDSVKFYGVRSNGTKYTATVASASWGASYAAGDVMSLALDIDNDRLYIAKNGLWCDGSGAYDQASPTAYVTLTSGDEWFFGCGDTQGGGTAAHSANFGNPTYALTSAEADENGYGAFEYAPPTGYLALCTKNLATDGG